MGSSARAGQSAKAAHSAKAPKTNAMRELDVAGITYDTLVYEEDDQLEAEGHNLGTLIAKRLGQDVDAAFKTLVLTAGPRQYVVACVPVSAELDLKKLAHAAGQKNLQLVPVKEIEHVSGYIRGGCSPVGMKRAYPTYIDETAQLFDTISVSGGARGVSLVLDPEALAAHVSATFADIVRD